MNLKKKMILKIVLVIMLIIQWKLLILIFRYILLDEKKKEENISNYIISYKATFIGSIPLRIRFNEINGFIKIYDGIRYSLLFTICMMKFEIGLNIL